MDTNTSSPSHASTVAALDAWSREGGDSLQLVCLLDEWREAIARARGNLVDMRAQIDTSLAHVCEAIDGAVEALERYGVELDAVRPQLESYDRAGVAARLEMLNQLHAAVRQAHQRLVSLEQQQDKVLLPLPAEVASSPNLVKLQYALGSYVSGHASLPRTIEVIRWLRDKVAGALAEMPSTPAAGASWASQQAAELLREAYPAALQALDDVEAGLPPRTVEALLAGWNALADAFTVITKAQSLCLDAQDDVEYDLWDEADQ